MIPHLPVNFVEKVWGHETWIVNNKRYCGKILYFKKGHSGSLHFHKNKHETFYMMSGEIKIQISDCVYVLKRGEVIDIPASVYHRVTAIRDSTIFEFSTPHDDADTYRLELSK